jgi:hypothetical protein
VTRATTPRPFPVEIETDENGDFQWCLNEPPPVGDLTDIYDFGHAERKRRKMTRAATRL